MESGQNGIFRKVGVQPGWIRYQTTAGLLPVRPYNQGIIKGMLVRHPLGIISALYIGLHHLLSLLCTVGLNTFRPYYYLSLCRALGLYSVHIYGKTLSRP